MLILRPQLLRTCLHIFKRSGKTRALLHFTKIVLCWKLILLLLKILPPFVDISSPFVEKFSNFAFVENLCQFVENFSYLCWKFLYLCWSFFSILLFCCLYNRKFWYSTPFPQFFPTFSEFFPHIWILSNFCTPWTLCTPCTTCACFQTLACTPYWFKFL